MLTVSNVSKRFGSSVILNDLSFQVKEHTIFGFLGNNGAGKTTTMKMIVGLSPMDSGSILVHGESVRYGETKTNQYIGYLSDVPQYYSYLTPKEYLMLCGRVSGIEKTVLNKRIPELLNLVGLSQYNKRIHGFSRGMKQRLGIAQALLNQPKLILCDEPTSALDPAGRREILDLLCSLKDQATIVFSTHILSDVEQICDEIGILHEGKIVYNETMDHIKQFHTTGFEIEFQSNDGMELFQSKYEKPMEQEGYLLRLNQGSELDIKKALYYLYQFEIPFQSIKRCESNLESFFLEVTNHASNNQLSI